MAEGLERGAEAGWKVAEPSVGETETARDDARHRAAIESMTEHLPALLATARVLVRQETEARDLVQTTLEIAIRHESELRDVSKLRHWLLAIEAREAMRLWRRLRRWSSLESTVIPIASQVYEVEPMLDLRQALNRLPLRMRTAVVLHHMAGFSVTETAAAMNIKQNTVKTEIATALRRLRENL